MSYLISKKILVAAALLISAFQLSASQPVKPFILADNPSTGFDQAVDDTRRRIASAGFEILGEYSPYDKATVIVFSSPYLRKIATESKRGGYGGAMRIAVTAIEDEIQVSYTNPLYWANAYRLSDNLQSVAEKLGSAVGNQQQYGSGDEILTEADMREYHYTVMMEYFDDPSFLAEHDSHEAAVQAVEDNLKTATAATRKVFRMDLGKDTEGREMTLFGIGLAGLDPDDCSSDQYIMSRIDKSSPRHTAHLPYELLVYGNSAEALYARFRIAISWPHLPMISSADGATFFSIMCAPAAIEKALVQVAGGEIQQRKQTEK